MNADIVAALKMRAAKEDDAEVCLDSTGESCNGDEFRGLPLETEFQSAEDFSFERDMIELREIADQAALDVADALIRNAPVRAWEAVQRLQRAVVSITRDYV